MTVTATGAPRYLSPTGDPWTALTNQPPAAGAMVLMTDGTVLMHDDYTNASRWFRLSPDHFGNYQDGTWSQIASMPTGYKPLYFASSIVPQAGKLLVEGGEYNNNNDAWTTQGAIYDPAANTWTSVTPPTGWTSIGDAQSILLPSAKMMLANCCTTQEALFNAVTQAWTSTGTGKADRNDEEGWTLLPNNKVLTVDASNPGPGQASPSEIYTPQTGTWAVNGTTPDTVVDSNSELGPAVYSAHAKRVLQFGATNKNDIFNVGSGTWSAGPSTPLAGFGADDAPGAPLRNGNVIYAADAGNFNPPTHVFEWYASTNSINQITDPPGAPSDSAFITRMLVLPSGQILFNDGTNVQVYSDTTSAAASSAPKIKSLSSTTLTAGPRYTLQGSQLAGLTQGSTYGDDVQSNTNYPLVRITNDASGVVTYAKTSGWSTDSIATARASSTAFQVAAGTPTGPSHLVVVANGVASTSVAVTVS